MSQITMKVSEAKEMIKKALISNGIKITEVKFESDAEITTLDKIIDAERSKTNQVLRSVVLAAYQKQI